MKTTLDCLPCFVRQALDAARLASPSPAVHERIAREVLKLAAGMDMDRPPPVIGQQIHRRVRAMTGLADPYRETKDRHNRMAMALVSRLEPALAAAPDPLSAAVRLAAAGNVIDLGAKTNGGVSEAGLLESVSRALGEVFTGDLAMFRKAVLGARKILYLADNAGEIAFDRLLIEQFPPGRVTVAVRGGPVINDATMADARAVGLDKVAEVIDNGSDAPGTLLEDCSREFRRHFAAADLVVAKGQGNFETLSGERREIHFLFKVKCPVIAEHARAPLGTHVLTTFTSQL